VRPESCVNGKLKMTEIALEPTLHILSPDDREMAMRVLTKAEQACLITNSIKTTVKVKPIVEILH